MRTSGGRGRRCTAASNWRAKSSADVGLSWDAAARAWICRRNGHQGERSSTTLSSSRLALAPKFEAMAPGCTSSTSTPNGASSRRRASLSACTAALEAQ